MCLFAGVWIITTWNNENWCHVFLVIQDDEDDDWYNDDDNCPEVAWAVVAFVDCALWTVTAYCIFYFVNSGRYEQAAACAVEQEQEEEGVAVEMAAVTAAPYATAPFSSAATVT